MFSPEQRKQLRELGQKIVTSVDADFSDGSLRKLAGQISSVVSEERVAAKAFNKIKQIPQQTVELN